MTGGSLGLRTASYGSMQQPQNDVFQIPNSFNVHKPSKMPLSGLREKERFLPFICRYLGRRNVGMLILVALALLAFLIGFITVNKEDASESASSYIAQTIQNMKLSMVNTVTVCGENNSQHPPGVPRICFVNKMDRLGANFFRTRDMIVTNLGAKPLVIQIPIGYEDNFKGVIDLVKMKAIIWSGEELGAKFVYEDVPADLRELAEDYRAQMIETIVELDDEAMEGYLEGVEPDEETIKKLIRKGTISASFVPVLCGSAFKNKGVQPLLDAVVDYLPSPLEVPPMNGTDPDNPEVTIERAPNRLMLKNQRMSCG